jgi:hypothetical protein
VHKAPQRGDTFLLGEVVYAAALFVLFSRYQMPILAAALQALSCIALQLFALVFTTVLYRLSPFHPLARFPGPLLHKATSLPMMALLYSGKHHEVIQNLHFRYGRFVRTGQAILCLPLDLSLMILLQDQILFRSTLKKSSSQYTHRPLPWIRLIRIDSVGPGDMASSSSRTVKSTHHAVRFGLPHLPLARK